jgi:membrane protein implicated in regulation of membrane protease activity
VGSDQQVIGKVGRVIGAIEPGRLGEVMIPIRGGSEAFYAYAQTTEEAIPRGARVIVVDHEPPRTIVVSRFG